MKYLPYYIAVILFILMLSCNYLTQPLPSTSTATPFIDPVQTASPSISSNVEEKQVNEITPIIIWSKTISNIYSDGAKSVYTENDNVFALSRNEQGLELIKISKDGEKVWSFVIDEFVVLSHQSDYEDLTYSIVVDAEENVYVSGQSSENWGSPITPFYNKEHSYTEYLGYDTFIAKIDSNGKLVWNTFLNAMPSSSLAIDSNGNIVLAVSALFESLDTNSLYWILKLNSNGELVFSQSYSDVFSRENFFQPYNVLSDSSSNIFVVSDDNSNSGTNVIVTKFTVDGVFLWEVSLGEDGSGYFSSSIDQQGNIYVLGTSRTSWGFPIIENPIPDPVRINDGTTKSFIVKISPDGDLEWVSFPTQAMYDSFPSLYIDITNGNSFITGISYSIFDPSTITIIDKDGKLTAKNYIDSSNLLTVNSIIFIDDNTFYVTGNNLEDEFIIVSGNFISDSRKYREAGPYTSELSTYIPTLDEVSTEPKVVFTNLILAFSFAILALPFSLALDIVLPSVNKAAEIISRRVNKLKILKWVSVKRDAAKRGTPNSVFDILKTFFEIFKLFVVMMIYGLVFSLLDSTWEPFSLKGAILFVEMTIAYGLVGIFDDIVQWMYIRRWGRNSQFSIRPTNFLLMVTSVAISRLVPLTPGLMFGSPEALKYNEEDVSKNRKDILLRVSLISYILIGLVSWLPTIFLNFILYQDIQAIDKEVLDIVGGLLGFMLIVFAVCLENLFIQLVGLTGGIGKKIREKNWAIWLAIWIPTAFLFLHTLLNPQNDFFKEFNAQSTLITVTCMVLFVFGVAGYALYKSFTSNKKSKK